MQTIQVVNATASDVPFLGLGIVAAESTKTGDVPVVTFDADYSSYIDYAANIGIAIRDLSGATAFAQTGLEQFTGASTVDDATRFAMFAAASVDYAAALPAAADVAAGVTIYFYLRTGAFVVALTPDGSDTVDGAVNYDLAATPLDAAPGFDIAATTLTRTDGGSWITEGYVEGGNVVILDATDGGNDGTYPVVTVTASILTLTGALTPNAADTTVHFGVDNRITLLTASPAARLQSDGVSNWTRV